MGLPIEEKEPVKGKMAPTTNSFFLPIVWRGGGRGRRWDEDEEKELNAGCLFVDEILVIVTAESICGIQANNY